MFVYFFKKLYIYTIKNIHYFRNRCRYLCQQNLFPHIVISGRQFSYNKANIKCQINLQPIFYFRLYFMLHYITDIIWQIQGQSTFDVGFFHCSYSQHSMLSEINVAGVYVITTGSLLQVIYIRCCRENSQHSVLDHPDFDNILIHI